MPTRCRRVRTALLLAVNSLACADSGLAPFEVQARRGTWDAREPFAYEVDVLRTCVCFEEERGPVTVVVIGGEVQRRFYLDSGEDVHPALATWFPDVDGLFDYLDDVRRSDPDRLEVRFDAEYGFPRRIMVDFDVRMIDDESGVRVLAFRPAAVSALGARGP